MPSVSAAGMIGQWEVGCHQTLTLTTHTLIEVKHTHGSKGAGLQLVRGREGGRQWKSKVSWSSGRPVFTLSHHILKI